MNGEPAHDPSLPAAALLAIDKICEAFEAEWKAGRQPQLEPYLADVAEPIRPALLRELMLLDEEYRARCRVQLDVVRGPHRGRKFVFDRHDSFLVGRASFAHFRLRRRDPGISRIHFMIEVNPPRCRLFDMGSTNGTRVNRRQVESADLYDGDLIQAGGTVLKVSFLGNWPASVASDGQMAQQRASAVERPHAPVSAAMETASRPREPLPTVPGYELLRELGRGGMGTVYLANRAADGTQVAVKIIRPATTVSEREVRCFLREANILRELRHPHIVAFHEMGQVEGWLYFVMEYVPGTDALQVLKHHGRLLIHHAVRMVCDVLEALQYAHARGFVHRDVKPANLLLGQEPGSAPCKLADFGLARVYHASLLSGLTLLGDSGGTMFYMPPEQITHYRDVTPAADQYAAAATLYHLLTGQYLFDLADDVPVARQLAKILLEQPVAIRDRRPDIPDALALAIHRALEKDPGARFADAAAFREALLPFSGLLNP
jgi:serine/threonine-protein kinase